MVAHILEGAYSEDGHYTECECGYATEKIAHTLEGKFDENGHWTACECGYATEKIAHTLEGKFDENGHWSKRPLGEGFMDWQHLLPRLKAHNDSLCVMREEVWPGRAEEERAIIERWMNGEPA